NLANSHSTYPQYRDQPLSGTPTRCSIFLMRKTPAPLIAERLENMARNPLARMAVAERVPSSTHLLVDFDVVEQVLDRRRNRLRASSNKPRAARLYGLGPFRGVPHHEHPLTKRRRFLLDTTRIGEDQVSPIHHLDEGEVAQRFEQVDPGTAGEALEHRTPDLRVQMHRINDRHVRVPLGDQAESVANRLERST